MSPRARNRPADPLPEFATSGRTDGGKKSGAENQESQAAPQLLDLEPGRRIQNDQETKDSRAAIGSRLRMAREALGIRQKELAARMKVSPAGLGKWELGERGIDGDALGRACEMLGLDPASILGTSLRIGPQDANHRLARLIQAEGTAKAAMTLGVKPEAMEAVVDGKLLVPVSEFTRLAVAYGVSATWLNSGNPDYWRPSLKSSWSSRVRFLRVSIGGMPNISPEFEDLWKKAEQDEYFAQKELTEDSGDLISLLYSLLSVDDFGKNMMDFPFKINWMAWKG